MSIHDTERSWQTWGYLIYLQAICCASIPLSEADLQLVTTENMHIHLLKVQSVLLLSQKNAIKQCPMENAVKISGNVQGAGPISVHVACSRATGVRHNTALCPLPQCILLCMYIIGRLITVGQQLLHVVQTCLNMPPGTVGIHLTAMRPQRCHILSTQT